MILIRRLGHSKFYWPSIKKFSQAAAKKIYNVSPHDQDEKHLTNLNSALRQTNEPMLICNEIDVQGRLHVSCGRILKSTLCASYGLQPRDLRKLDGTLKNNLPVILVRSSAVLVNLGTVKAIIRHNGVTLFEGLDIEERLRQQEYIQEIQNKLKTNNTSPASSQQPFEFVVLETILQKTLQSLQDEFDELSPTVEEHLAALQRYVQWDRLKILLSCKLKVTLFQERVNSIRNCIGEVLESDDDMAGMYLSHKASLFSRPINAHEEVELLLESYLKTAEEISSRLQVLITDMQSTEDIVNIGLVGQRNELLLLELKLGIGTFAASMGGFGASVLGMNLQNHMEHAPHAFSIVLGSLLTVAGTSFALTWRRLMMLIKKH